MGVLLKDYILTKKKLPIEFKITIRLLIEFIFVDCPCCIYFIFYFTRVLHGDMKNYK